VEEIYGPKQCILQDVLVFELESLAQAGVHPAKLARSNLCHGTKTLPVLRCRVRGNPKLSVTHGHEVPVVLGRKILLIQGPTENGLGLESGTLHSGFENLEAVFAF